MDLDAFFAAFEEDLQAGRRLGLEDYQRRWPEQAAAIAAVWAEFQEKSTGGGIDALVARHLDTGTIGGQERVGPYRLLRLLGAGGMGEVWLAEEDRPRRHVALKILRQDRFFPEALRRFEHEAEVLARLQHPGIAQIHAAGRAGQDGTPYIAMQYVEGESLAQRIARRNTGHTTTGAKGTTAFEPRTREDALEPVRLVEKAARALHAAHEAGVIHRDVKPGNILINADGDPVLVDFGIARDLSGDAAALTRTGQTPGTPLYMSPEQIAGRGPTDRRTDVWSLAVTLHECLAGRPPFTATSYEALREDILNRDPALDRRLSRTTGVPRDLEVVIAKALEKDPDRRYPTAAAFADDLKAVLERRPVAARPVSAAGRTLRWARREPARAALVLLLLLAVGAAGALATWIVSTRKDVALAEEARRRDAIETAIEEGYFHLGELAIRNAESAFRRALDVDAASIEAQAGLALAALQAKAPARAVEVLAGFAPLPPPLRRIEAEARRRNGDDDGAREIERDLAPPAGPLEHFLAGRVELTRGGFRDTATTRQAIEHLSVAVMSSPRAIYLFELAYAAGYAGDRDTARRVAATLKERWPDSGQAWLRACFALHRSRADIPGAASAAEEARKRLPHLAAPHAYVASTLIALGRYAESEQAARAALAIDPQLFDGWTNLGDALRSLGRHRESEAALRRALEIRPASLETRNGLGLSLHFQERHPEARAVFAELLAEKPDYVEAHINLGLVLAKEKDVDGAIASYRRALDLRPDAPEAWGSLAKALQWKRDFKGAVEAFEKAIAAAPWHPAIRSDFGILLKDLGRLEEARAVLEEELRRFPETAEAHCNLGHVLFRLKRFREAHEHFKTGHDLGSRREVWSFPSAGWVEESAGKAAVEAKLDRRLAGETVAAAAAELAEMAGIALARGRALDAVRLWREAFDADPSLADDLRGSHRYDAACAAALAAAAADPGAAGAGSPAELRAGALAWLQAELAAWRRRAESGRSRDRDLVRRLDHWVKDPDLAPVRDTAPLAALPDGERTAWTHLWAAVAAFRAEIE